MKRGVVAENGEGGEGLVKLAIGGEGFNGVYKGAKGMVGEGRNAGRLLFFFTY